MIRTSPSNSIIRYQLELEDRVDYSSLFLLGSLFKEKCVTVTKTWTFPSPNSLRLSIPNANIFSFQNRNLYSDFLDSSAYTYCFSQNDSTLATDSLVSYNCKGFCLRAHISGTFLHSTHLGFILLIYVAFY